MAEPTRPYTAKQWNNGDIITAAKLNDIENIVASIDSEIVKARNYNSSSTGSIGSRIDELVQISNTQPGGNNEIWVNSNSNTIMETQVPTYSEFEALRDSMAQEYSESALYSIGDYVIHEEQLYRCTTEIATAETWTAAHWKRVVFGDEVSASNENLNNTNASVLDVAAPHVTASAWKMGGLNGTTGAETTAARLIRTGFFPISDEAQYVFTGVKTSDRFFYNYFYDAEKKYISRQNNDVIPTGSKYVRFTYGFNSSSEETVESYGFANLIADWSCEITSPMQKQIGELSTSVNTALDIAGLALALDCNNAAVIPDDTDYDTLMTPGNYRVNNVASAETMTNCPTSKGHRLFVMSSTAAARIYQIIIANDAQPGIFIRFYSDRWLSWYKVPLEAV